jgi:hypothetical protein
MIRQSADVRRRRGNYNSSMSFSAGKRYVCCDGEKCTQMTALPVGLRTSLSEGKEPPKNTVEGWIFVANGDEYLHFCPRCVPKYLLTLAQESA